jgi:hypothetical protein
MTTFEGELPGKTTEQSARVKRGTPR